MATAITVPAEAGKTWLGHPRGLFLLFFAEMWERFSYYGMRAILIFYLTKHFLFGEDKAYILYGAYTSLVYITPVIGGYLADRFLGPRKAVLVGGVFIAIGHFLIAITEGPGGQDAFYLNGFYLALASIIVGTGFLKANISVLVGELYARDDHRRDPAFSIFYMGINLGSLFSQILCPFLAVALGWWAGFGLAAIGMMISWGLIQFAGDKLAGYGDPPEGQEKDRSLLIYICALAVVPIGWFLFINLMSSPAPQEGAGIVGYLLGLPIMGKVLFATFLASVIFIPLWSWKAGNRAEFQMMVAAIVMIVFNVVFWTLFEQAGSSLTLFADRNTDLSVFGLFTMSAGQTQFFNAFFIVTLAPLTSIMWGVLGRRGLEPSIPVKFAIALAGVGLGFLLLVWGTTLAGPDFRVSVWWLALLYLVHSMAELCISPVGLSMITKLSIARVVGLMMGLWFLSISCAQYVAGIVAQVASVETVGGQVTNLKVSLETYAGVFQTIGLASVGIGAVLLVLSPFIKRWMHGVQ